MRPYSLVDAREGSRAAGASYAPPMTGADLAEALADYDLQLAEQVLRSIVRELGGPEDADARRLQAFLAVPQPTEDEPRRTTGIWKIEFARDERLRELGLSLAQLVRGR